jgi:hypothetical protein
MKKFEEIFFNLFIFLFILYLWLVWMHSVFMGKIDFDIFGNGGYKQVLLAIIGSIGWTLIASYYDKKKKQKKARNKKISDQES